MAFYSNPQQVFADALENLLVTRNFESITVNDILKAASCSRSTFYRYFEDKYDLVSWIYSDLVRQAIASCPENIFYSLSESLCRLYSTKPVFFKRMWSLTGQNSFPELFFNYTVGIELNQIRYCLNTDIVPKDLELAVKFFVAGIEQIIKDWVLSGMNETPAFIAKTCVLLCPQELSCYLDGILKL